MARRLVRHPVGELPLPARWYLAILALAALMLTAVHIVQQERLLAAVRDGVQHWLQAAGGGVREVRYRMLRGHLEADGLKLMAAGFRVFAERLQWSARLAANGELPAAVRDMRIEGLRAVIAGPFGPALARLGKAAGTKSLPTPEVLHIDGGSLRLEDVAGGLELTHLRLERTGRGGKHDLKLDARMLGGEVHLDWHSKRRGPDFVGLVRWQHVAVQPWIVTQPWALGLKVGAGDGRMRFTGSWQHGVQAASGSMQFRDVAVQDDSGRKLAFAERVHMDISRWQPVGGNLQLASLAAAAGFARLHVAGAAAPADGLLARWRRYADGLGGKIAVARVQLTDMRLHIADTTAAPPLLLPLAVQTSVAQAENSGGYTFTAQTTLAQVPLQLSGRLGEHGWRIRGRARGVPLANVSAYLPQFGGRRLTQGNFAGEVVLQGDGADWEARISGEIAGLVYADADRSPWQAGRLHLRDARIRPRTREVHIAAAQLDEGRALLSAPATKAHPPWRLRCDAMNINRLHVAGDGFALPPLSGAAHTDGEGVLAFVLSGEEASESWRFDGQVDVAAHSLQTRLRAQNVLLSRLRPLLPPVHLPGVEGEPELGGTVAAQLGLRADASSLRLGGSLIMQDVIMAQGGDEWRAEQLRIELVDIGSGRARQHVRAVEAKGWHYHMALRPLTPQALNVAPARHGSGDWREWRIDRLHLAHGVVSLGAMDDEWLRDVTLSTGSLAAGRLGELVIRGRLDETDFDLRGQIDVLAAVPRFALRGRFAHATPFFLAPWFAVSGMPRLVRGRLDADLHLKTRRGDRFEGRLQLRLRHGAWEQGLFANDPMLALLGYNTHDAFARLIDAHGNLLLDVPLRGRWHEQPLGLASLGKAVLAQLQQRLRKRPTPRPRITAKVVQRTQVRLRSSGPFSQNERQRLNRFLRLLRRDKKLIVELVPQLDQALAPEIIRRVRHTQRKIEAYLRRRGIDRARIFPVWPGPGHQRKGASGIRILAKQYPKQAYDRHLPVLFAAAGD